MEDEDGSQPPDAIGIDPATDLVITVACGSSRHLRSVVADMLRSGSAPMLVASRPQLERGLVVLEHDLAPSLADVLLREPFCQARHAVALSRADLAR